MIGFMWIIGALLISNYAQVGLTWLAALSTLSAFSYYTVRQNEEFEFGI